MSRARATHRTKPTDRTFIVVAYDISDDKRRAKVAEVILSFGARIQGSVYELWLDERRVERMWAMIEEELKPGDLVRCYSICAACRRRIRSYGMEQPEDDIAFIV